MRVEADAVVVAKAAATQAAVGPAATVSLAVAAVEAAVATKAELAGRVARAEPTVAEVARSWAPRPSAPSSMWQLR